MKTLFLCFLLVMVNFDRQAAAEDIAAEFFAVTDSTRCPVCGMFVGKYPKWLTQVRMSDGTTAAFDGVKDMAAYFFSPEDFGAAKGAVVKDIAVKDYYSLAWTDGRKAIYVLGSDIAGPMGHELIPFLSRDGAENFQKDHGGSKVLGFTEITPELIESLRKGHKMKGHSMPGMK
ncbi:MAG: nitrous oxide reductase accessory protein NosL [Proteobacteria bacterium]|nr:nitrous oxide reductase accessory protein NosL [Pseudomonadota bacterium]